ncbi:hypothetical protein [Vibrio mangrovi]|uniref:Uncharacterized protein n=1 Tax=Vibrio mangrovi TaxID=474394 RepID=A0A1Y6IZR3_9VIBR|nr:hypothetical protein [Vibrio mangrovi]MDW6002488.1 hypothetical protein [Vibrio mangrovi]SMS01982.1 hypothetical protein VIM7927_03293 [Vibrio mangrovi]
MFMLFSLLLQHHFFCQAQWLGAQLVPDRETRQWMSHFQMQLTSNLNCWSLYGYAIPGRSAFLQGLTQLTEGNPLRFWICQPLENFVMLTDLPVNWKGLLHYDNRQITSGNLQQAEHQQQSELVAAHVPFNHAPDGAVAEVLFYPDKLMVQESYAITLQSRSSRWEYRVIQRGQLKLHQPQVVDESGTLNFPEPVRYETEAGESGWRVNSGSQRLPLAQVPEQRFKLIDKQVIDAQAGQTIQRTILPALPAPGTDQFCMEQEEGDLISVMYVYL